MKQLGKQFLNADEPDSDSGSLWRHRKGGLYRLVLVAKRESTEQPEVVYRDCITGTAFIRPVDEFLDGRFHRINPAG